MHDRLAKKYSHDPELYRDDDGDIDWGSYRADHTARWVISILIGIGVALAFSPIVFVAALFIGGAWMALRTLTGAGNWKVGKKR